MAQEPITIFARLADPAGVLKLLRQHDPKLQLEEDETTWRKAIVALGRGKKKTTLTILHNPDYYAGPDWAMQMDGMRGYFANFPDTPNKAKVLRLTTTFAFSLGTLFTPDFDPSGDPRLSLLFDVTAFVDGVLFTPSSLRDANGRILFSADGDEDPDAKWPRVLGSFLMKSGAGEAMHEASRPKQPADEATYRGPKAKRVAARALAFTALTARALLEQETEESDRKATLKDLRAWVQALDLDDEFEPEERALIKKPLGKIESQAMVNAAWRLEALVVLAWALQRFELPPHDELVHVNELWKSLCLFDAAAAKKLLAKPTLRPPEELRALQNRLFAIHWRMRNYQLDPKAMDFADYAKTCWFGPLDLAGLPLIKKDMAIGKKRIDQADPSALSTTHSTAMERHMAANWLWEGPATYSDASQAT